MSEYKALTDQQVGEAVKQLVAKGRIWWTKHAEEKMAIRGIDRAEVKECLLKGHFVEPPIIPNRGGDIEYKFKMGCTIDQEPVEVVATLKPSNGVLVITAIHPH